MGLKINHDPTGKPFKNTTVLVTGAAGFIGSHAVLHLLHDGYRVVGIDDYSRGFEHNIEALKQVAKEQATPRCLAQESCTDAPLFEFAELDVGDEPALDAFITKHQPSAMMHFAGVAYVTESTLDPNKYYENNTVNVLKITKALAKHQIRNFVFSSSCATYGAPTHMPITEETPQVPVSPYGRSKLVAEWILRDWLNSRPRGETKIAALRYFNVFGSDPEGRLGERPPKQFTRGTDIYKKSARVLIALFDAAQNLSPNFQISGNKYDTPDGTPLRDYIHVTDLVRAHVDVLGSMMRDNDDLPHYRYYNIGTGKPASIVDIAKAVKEVTGFNFEVKIGENRAGDPPSVWADPAKVAKEIGWVAKYDMKDSIRHAWEFRQQHVVAGPSHSPDAFASAPAPPPAFMQQMDPQGAVLSDEFGISETTIQLT